MQYQSHRNKYHQNAEKKKILSISILEFIQLQLEFLLNLFPLYILNASMLRSISYSCNYIFSLFFICWHIIS